MSEKQTELTLYGGNLPQLDTLLNLTSICINSLPRNDFPEEQGLSQYIMQNLTKLEILEFKYDCFDEEFDLSKLTNLKRLHLGHRFNKNIDLSMNTKLEWLNLGSELYNKPIDLSKLTELKSVCFGNKFNQDVKLDTLTNLKDLNFGHSFNKQIDLSKLTNLGSLEFGYDFDQDLDLSHCTNLYRLELKDCYKRPLDLEALEKLPYMKHIKKNAQ